jgi:hypothetical protein
MANPSKILRDKGNGVDRAQRHGHARSNDDDVEISWQVHTFLDEHALKHFKAPRKRLSESVQWAFSIAEQALTQAAELFRTERTIATMLRALDRRIRSISSHMDGPQSEAAAELKLEMLRVRDEIVARGSTQARIEQFAQAHDLISGFDGADAKRLEIKRIIERAAAWERKRPGVRIAYGDPPDLRRVSRARRGDIADATLVALAIMMQLDQFVPEERPEGLHDQIRKAIDAWNDERRGAGHKKDTKKFDGLNQLLILLELGVKDGKTLRDILTRKENSRRPQRRRLEPDR